MFCPNCGGENSAELAFCRSCGENLKIISQAMSGNAPLAIANKIEEALSSNAFRLKRDAIWIGFVAVVATIATIVGGPLLFTSQIVWLQTLGMILVPAALFLYSGRDYLAYWRSLEGKRPPGLDGPQVRKLPGAADEIQSENRDEQVFCPSCGTENRSQTQYCRSCGGTLVFEPTGLERRLPAFVIRNLDQRIANNEKIQPPQRSLKRTAIVGGLLIFNASFQLISSGITFASGASLIGGLTALVLGTWDYLTFRRNNPYHEAERDPSFAQDVGLYFSDPSRRSNFFFQILALAVISVGLVIWFPELAMMMLPVFVLVALAGTGLKIRAFSNELTDERRRAEIARLSGIDPHEGDDLETYALPEGEGTTQNLDIASSPTVPLSVTEDTTKPLISENEQDIEHGATTRKLDAEGS